MRGLVLARFFFDDPKVSQGGILFREQIPFDEFKFDKPKKEKRGGGGAIQ